MRLAADGTLRLSPSDLANHLACPHLTQLELKVQREGLKRPVLEDAYGSLVREKGNLHERGYLERLEATGKRVRRMAQYEDVGFDSETARQATEDAIRAGEDDVIYQAYLSDGTWRGFADFLERRPDGTYEPVDTKLAVLRSRSTSSSSASTPSSSSGFRSAARGGARRAWEWGAGELSDG